MPSNGAAPDIPTAVQQYTQDINVLCQYTQAILTNQGQMPSLSGFTAIDQSDYDSFTQEFSVLVQNAQNWQNDVQPSLNALIQTLSDNSALATDQLGNAQGAVQLLQNNPADSKALQDLQASLDAFVKNMGDLSSYVSNTLSLVKNNQDIMNSVSELQQISQNIGNMLSTAQIDISTVNSSLSNLNQQLTVVSRTIVVDEILEGGGGFLMLVGFALTLTGNPGGVGLFFCGLCLASIESQNEIMDQQTMESLQAQVGALQSQLTNDTAAYTVAQTASTLAGTLANTLSGILADGSPMEQIESFIGTVLNDFQQIKTDVNQATADEGNWAQVSVDLQDACNQWQAIQQLIGNAGNYSISFSPSQTIVIHGNA